MQALKHMQFTVFTGYNYQ